jgi:hypothetical protein
MVLVRSSEALFVRKRSPRRLRKRSPYFESPPRLSRRSLVARRLALLANHPFAGSSWCR